MVFTTPLVAGPGPLTLAEHIGNQGGLEASALLTLERAAYRVTEYCVIGLGTRGLKTVRRVFD